MPQNVRNFWLELDVDGRKSRIACGPQSKDGGFILTIKQRDKGGIIKAMYVVGTCTDGLIRLTAERADNVNERTEVTTSR